jgi:DNA ligase D-like protein (predicted 3'-phosphoesterase)
MDQADGVVRGGFVLHDHRRPRRHFDLRLEENGVLRSWAVPRGMPQQPRQNRLAIQVPDHDLDHLTYEDADKSIADIGTWELEDRDERRFVFVLRGRSGARRYALIRTGENDDDWLLHLTVDQP